MIWPSACIVEKFLRSAFSTLPLDKANTASNVSGLVVSTWLRASVYSSKVFSAAAKASCSEAKAAVGVGVGVGVGEQPVRRAVIEAAAMRADRRGMAWEVGGSTSSR